MNLFSKKHIARCDYCGQFKKYKDLKIDEFIPDTHFSSEDFVWICKKCIKKQDKQNEYNK